MILTFKMSFSFKNEQHRTLSMGVNFKKLIKVSTKMLIFGQSFDAILNNTFDLQNDIFLKNWTHQAFLIGANFEKPVEMSTNT